MLQRNIGKKFENDYFDICADSGASSCATPDEIDFIPGNYKNLTGVTINFIAEGLKVSGCGSFSWILQYDKKENIEIIIERVLHILGLPIMLVFPQQVTKQTGHADEVLHVEKDKARLIFGGFKFTTNYHSSSGLPIYNYVNGISKFKAYNMELHQDGVITDIFTPSQRSLLKWHRQIGHTNFRSIIRFARLGLIPSILTTIREEDITRCSAFFLRKEGCTSPNTNGSGSGIAYEHDQPVICISINQIESPQGGRIPVLKLKQKSRKHHVATTFVDRFSKLTYVHFRS